MAETMTADEIREIRGMYGLTQKSFAQLLGIGVASIVRYEQGSEPSKANANLIRAARHPEFMLECLERDGDSIALRQREQATRCVYACISLDPDTEIEVQQMGEKTKRASGPQVIGEKTKETTSTLTMDEVYHYTIQQEVLNEQAANLACDFMEYMLANDIEMGDRTNPVSALLLQLLEMKRRLLSINSDDDVALCEIAGYFKYLKVFIEDLNALAEVA